MHRVLGRHTLCASPRFIGKVPQLTDLFEFTCDGPTAEAALAQIKERGYATPYLHEDRPIVLVELAFDNAKRERLGITHALIPPSKAP